MLVLCYLFILHQTVLMESVGTVRFIGPVHVSSDRKFEFSCYPSTKEPFQIMEILFTNNYNRILSVMPGNDCELERQYRPFVFNCKLEDGILKYEMQFQQLMEGIYICRINVKRDHLMEKRNILFNVSSPIFNMTRKDIYFPNETIVPSCVLENNKNGSAVFILLTYKNGQIVEISRANTTFSTEVTAKLYLNKSMNGASLGCGIQYEFSRYIENYTTLHVSYPMEEIQSIPVKSHYYYNDTVLCSADGNPNPIGQWQALNESQRMNDTIVGALVTFSELLGKRPLECTVKQNFKNETLTLRKIFRFDVILFTTTATTISPTPRWTNMSLIFIGDQFSKSNISQHHWEIVPKWVGFINGSIMVNDKEVMYFNNTDVIQYPTFIFDVVMTSFSITYKISEPALHGMYKCQILNKYIETLENSTVFIKGENPSISLVTNGRNYTVTCSTIDLGSPPGTLRMLKRLSTGHVGILGFGTDKSYNITQYIHFEWTDNDATLFCVNKNSYYNWVSNSIVINITFPVRDMEITPNISHYGSGDIVKCIAKGNPLPVIVWSSNINDSFNLRTNPNVIQLTPQSTLDVNYTCAASNYVDGKSYVISRSIMIYGSSDEFIEFSAIPAVVGLPENVVISCRVRKLNAVNVMNILDNDEEMISFASNSFTVHKLYRNKISNIASNVTTLSFAANFRNDSARTISCRVVFPSNNRAERRIELRNQIEIIYGKSNTAINGSFFQVSCVQRLRNGLLINIGVPSSNNNTHLQYKHSSNVSELISFSFVVTNNMHGSQPYCALEDSNVELSRTLGEQLFIVYISHDLQINPYKNEYNQSESVECTAEGRPKPKITWILISGNQLIINGNVLVLLKGTGEYVYECIAESIYKTERAFVRKQLKFLIRNSKSLMQYRIELNLIWIVFLLISHIF